MLVLFPVFLIRRIGTTWNLTLQRCCVGYRFQEDRYGNERHVMEHKLSPWPKKAPVVILPTLCLIHICRLKWNWRLKDCKGKASSCIITIKGSRVTPAYLQIKCSILPRYWRPNSTVFSAWPSVLCGRFWVWFPVGVTSNPCLDFFLCRLL